MSDAPDTTLRVLQDESAAGGGHAVLRFEGVGRLGDDLRYTLEDRGMGRCLAPDGTWSEVSRLLQAREYRHEGDTLDLHVGPEVVNRVIRFSQIEVRVPDSALSGRVRWPTLRVAGGSQALPTIEPSAERPPRRVSGETVVPETPGSHPVVPDAPEIDGPVRDGPDSVPVAPDPVPAEPDPSPVVPDPVDKPDPVVVPHDPDPGPLRPSVSPGTAEDRYLEWDPEDVVPVAPPPRPEGDPDAGVSRGRVWAAVSLALLTGVGAGYAGAVLPVLPVLDRNGSADDGSLATELAEATAALERVQAVSNSFRVKLDKANEALGRANADLSTARERSEASKTALREVRGELQGSRRRVQSLMAEAEDRQAMADDLRQARDRAAVLERRLREATAPRRLTPAPTPPPAPVAPYESAEIARAINALEEFQSYRLVKKRGFVERLAAGECLADSMRRAFGEINRIHLGKLKRRLPALC